MLKSFINIHINNIIDHNNFIKFQIFNYHSFIIITITIFSF